MRYAALLLCAAGLCQAAEALNRLSKQEKKEGYILLFNGKNLKGWDGDPALWSVKDGVLVGSSDGHPVKVNTFLIYNRPFANFILKAEVKLRNHNSGIQFRSTQLPGAGWMVAGYQTDFSEAGERSAWGNFYEERGRGRGVMDVPDRGWQTGKKVYRKGEWNSIEIHADGPRIQLKVNGTETIDTKDDKASSGILAIQLHAGEPMRVEVRNLKLKPLP